MVTVCPTLGRKLNSIRRENQQVSTDGTCQSSTVTVITMVTVSATGTNTFPEPMHWMRPQF